MHSSGALFAPLLAETGALADRLRQSVVLVRCGVGGSNGYTGGHGSGVFWPAAPLLTNGDALVVTNDHVVAGAADRRRGHGRIEIELADGRRLPATVVARDRENDLAALRIPAAPDLPPPVPIGDARNLRVGELIVAVGNPFGVRGTTTLGIVSGAPGSVTWLDGNGESEAYGGNRRQRGGGTNERRRDLLQADVVLAPGNSGGPLANAHGRVVGIAAMILSPGIALAVPAHVVEQFLASALAAPATAPRQAVAA